jgi:hypothetical protein
MLQINSFDKLILVFNKCHIYEHTENDPKKIIHGFFDISNEDMDKLIEEITKILQEKNNKNLRSYFSGQQLIYDIDMGRKIGWIGGQRGEEMGFPTTTFIRVIMDGRMVISCYPAIIRLCDEILFHCHQISLIEAGRVNTIERTL